MTLAVAPLETEPCDISYPLGKCKECAPTSKMAQHTKLFLKINFCVWSVNSGLLASKCIERLMTAMVLWCCWEHGFQRRACVRVCVAVCEHGFDRCAFVCVSLCKHGFRRSQGVNIHT
jgi:hypothetical protein